MRNLNDSQLFASIVRIAIFLIVPAALLNRYFEHKEYEQAIQSGLQQCSEVNSRGTIILYKKECK